MKSSRPSPSLQPDLLVIAQPGASDGSADGPTDDWATVAALAARGPFHRGLVPTVTATPEPPQRARLADLDSHLHCSVIGTCLSTTELRKTMQRFIDTTGLDDLAIHHEAVRLTALEKRVAHALDKLLDRRHDATLRRFARARSVDELADLWQEARRSGEIPGAYWAVLTHRHGDSTLCQQAFGDVHMLSHLVGAANRADIRRLVALEQENAALQERNDRLHERAEVLIGERATEAQHGLALRARISDLEEALRNAHRAAPDDGDASRLALTNAVALHTSRREAADSKAATPLDPHLQGRRIVYVGGRPSSQPAIRAYVETRGGSYYRHDGGIEDRKGLLANALAGADLVVFPVDCIDHDSALHLKRACLRQGTPFIPLRTASVTSFAAALRSTGRAVPDRRS